MWQIDEKSVIFKMILLINVMSGHSYCEKCERTLPKKLAILGKGYRHRSLEIKIMIATLIKPFLKLCWTRKQPLDILSEKWF